MLSVFGVMFAPDHQLAAAELWRVCKPGGRIVLAAWTPSGGMSELSRILAEGAPPPPPGFQPPPLWGDIAHLEKLFAGTEISASVERLAFRYDSVDHWLQFNEAYSGPIALAKAGLEAQGRWTDVRARIRQAALAASEAEDGGFLLSGQYLLAAIPKPP